MKADISTKVVSLSSERFKKIIKNKIINVKHQQNIFEIHK